MIKKRISAWAIVIPLGLLAGGRLASQSPALDSFGDLARRVLPAVVEIGIAETPVQPLLRPLLPAGREGEPPTRLRSAGSGVIVRRAAGKAYVLTTHRLIGQTGMIAVRLYDQREFRADRVGQDEKRDMALLVFQTGEPVAVAELGNSDTVQVGDRVLALGGPFAAAPAISAGIVRDVGRQSPGGNETVGLTDYIKSDAVRDPRLAGGALVNMEGLVIGLNTWNLPGLAIPINNARKAIEDFITKGHVEYGWLGIRVGNLPAAAAKDMGVENIPGAFVYGVFRDSPAEGTGFLPGDYITRINGEGIRDSTQLLIVVADQVPGQDIEFALIRQGARVSLKAALSARQEESEIARQGRRIWPGMSVARITEDLRRQLKLGKGSGDLIVALVERGSPAGIAGFHSGDILKKLNGQELKSLSDYYRLLNDSASEELTFTVARGGMDVFLGFSRRK